MLGMAGETSAQLGSRPNYGNRLGTHWEHETSFLPQGVQVALNSIDPAVRKWYVPQEVVRRIPLAAVADDQLRPR